MEPRFKKVIEYIEKKKGIRFVRVLHPGEKTYLYLGHLPEADHVGKYYVVKFILPGHESKFKQESLIASHLKHRNIVRYEASENLDPKVYQIEKYIITDYIDGPILSKLIQKLGYINIKITVGQAISIIKEVLVAINHIHNRKSQDGSPLNIVYKDISPNNVIISREGEVKLFDFGLSSVGDEDDLKVAGTHHYVSPEVFEGKGGDQRSDIYSITTLLATLLNMSVYNDKTIESLKQNDVIDDDLCEILKKGTDKNPSNRFQSAEEFIKILDEYLRNNNIFVYTNELKEIVNQAITSDDQSTFFKESKTKPEEVKSEGIILPPTDKKKKKPKAVIWGVVTGLCVVFLIIFMYSPKDEIPLTDTTPSKTKEITTVTDKPSEEVKTTGTDKVQEETKDKAKADYWKPIVTIVSNQANIRIVSDSKSWSSRSRLSIKDYQIMNDVEEASFKVTVSRKGYKAKNFSFKLSPDKSTYQKTVTLEKFKYGEVVIGTSPLGKITISNYAGPSTGRLRVKLPAGSHQVVIKWEGTKTFYKKINVKPNQTLKCQAMFSLGLKSMNCY